MNKLIILLIPFLISITHSNLLNLSKPSKTPFVSIFYCGFGGDYCGQSSSDDINPSAKFVILAFANTANITGSFNATNGMLTLTGTDTVANYQAALAQGAEADEN